jgi:phosphate transport system substrate-binding protein
MVHAIRHHRRARRGALSLAVAMAGLAGLLTGCTSGSASASGLHGTLVISGSSTVEPISTRAAELFNDREPNVDITVDGPGTGDGFKRFCKGDVDIADASRKIKDEEKADCAAEGVEYVELPIAFDGLAVMTDHKNDSVSCLNLADLYALIGPESKGVSTWAQAMPLAHELGSNTELPDKKLKITAPGTESGTYDTFVQLVVAPIAKQRVAAGKLKAADADVTRPDYTSASDDNTILANVEGQTGSLGWIGFAFAAEAGDHVRDIAISKVGGQCVNATTETIANGSYPLARTLYVYVNKASLHAKPALAAYVDFYLGDGYQKSVTTALGTFGYVPLPAAQLAQTVAAWNAAKQGAVA